MILIIAAFVLYGCSNASTSIIADEIAHEIDNGEIIIEHISGFYPHYLSIETLDMATNYVVQVEIIDKRTEMLNTWIIDSGEPIPSDHYRGYSPHTVHTVRVLEVFKGDVEIGDIMDIRQSGGQVGNLKVVNSNMIDFALGDELLMFLNPWGYPMNPTQSIYSLPAIYANPFSLSLYDEIGRFEDYSAPLESFHHGNDLVLTIGDLLQIAEDNNRR